MAGFGVFYSVYSPMEILMLREWPDSKVPTLPCPREISLDLFDVNSGIAGRNIACSRRSDSGKRCKVKRSAKK